MQNPGGAPHRSLGLRVRRQNAVVDEIRDPEILHARLGRIAIWHRDNRIIEAVRPEQDRHQSLKVLDMARHRVRFAKRLRPNRPAAAHGQCAAAAPTWVSGSRCRRNERAHARCPRRRCPARTAIPRPRSGRLPPARSARCASDRGDCWCVRGSDYRFRTRKGGRADWCAPAGWRRRRAAGRPAWHPPPSGAGCNISERAGGADRSRHLNRVLYGERHAIERAQRLGPSVCGSRGFERRFAQHFHHRVELRIDGFDLFDVRADQFFG